MVAGEILRADDAEITMLIRPREWVTEEQMMDNPSAQPGSSKPTFKLLIQDSEKIIEPGMFSALGIGD